MTEDTILQTSTANGSWSSPGGHQTKRLSITFSTLWVGQSQSQGSDGEAFVVERIYGVLSKTEWNEVKTLTQVDSIQG